MRNILILGAGKSSVALIDYLVKHAKKEHWQVTVADITAENAYKKTKGRANTLAIGFNLNNAKQRRALIKDSSIVISMLPAALHMLVATDCLALKRNLVTPSYISDEMRALNDKVAKSGLIFMNEMGLDPGIDHMSSMKMIHELQAGGNQITAYQSHCGGLVAPESDDNPWHYKFTWNPRNVILAGQGSGFIQYLSNGKTTKLKYPQLFASARPIRLKNAGVFETYANRDSLKYINEYGLQKVKTMYRGTLRRPPFCQGWQTLIDLGFTQNKEVNFKKLLARFNQGYAALPPKTKKLIQHTGLNEALKQHRQSTINPALFLQSVLEKSWAIKPTDKDLIVMLHQITYTTPQQKQKQLQAWLVYKGKNNEQTAMAITVGLPVAIVTRLILNGKVAQRGVLMPKQPEIYNPVLNELKNYGISFTEKISTLATQKK